MSEKKERIAFFDTKPYDRVWFDQLNRHYHIKYYEHKLTPDSVSLAQGCRAVIPFVNDTLDKTVIDGLCEAGVEMIALRCAGYNNVDRQAAAGRIAVTRVPGYSPYAVAEFTMGLLLTLNRKIHKAYFRTRDFNFSLNGLVGFDLHGRTVGVIGTGKIGQIFIRICRGFGMKLLAYDLYPDKTQTDLNYVSLETLLSSSDLISLHCPLTPDTYHMINKESISRMKDGVILVNTSRGGLICTEDLIAGIRDHKFFAVGLDVYEEESDFVYEDMSEHILKTSTVQRLLSFPNVALTSHQGFFTEEALTNIAETTLENAEAFRTGQELRNEVHV